MIVGRVVNKVINVFTGLFGIATLVLMLIIYLNNAVGGLIPSVAAQNIAVAKEYCTLATVFCAGIEFTLKRNVILAIIFAGLIVVVALFMLYTDLSFLLDGQKGEELVNSAAALSISPAPMKITAFSLSVLQ